MSYAYDDVVIAGYIISIQYVDEAPPQNIVLPDWAYRDGYYIITITVTSDNLSVTEQVREAFMVRTIESAELHGTVKHGETVVIPLNGEQRIEHIVSGCKRLDIGQGSTDFDTIFFLLSTDREDDYGSAWLLFKHDKEELFDKMLG